MSLDTLFDAMLAGDAIFKEERQKQTEIDLYKQKVAIEQDANERNRLREAESTWKAYDFAGNLVQQEQAEVANGVEAVNTMKMLAPMMSLGPDGVGQIGPAIADALGQVPVESLGQSLESVAGQNIQARINETEAPYDTRIKIMDQYLNIKNAIAKQQNDKRDAQYKAEANERENIKLRLEAQKLQDDEKKTLFDQKVKIDELNDAKSDAEFNRRKVAEELRIKREEMELRAAGGTGSGKGKGPDIYGKAAEMIAEQSEMLKNGIQPSADENLNASINAATVNAKGSMVAAEMMFSQLYGDPNTGINSGQNPTEIFKTIQEAYDHYGEDAEEEKTKIKYKSQNDKIKTGIANSIFKALDTRFSTKGEVPNVLAERFIVYMESKKANDKVAGLMPIIYGSSGGGDQYKIDGLIATSKYLKNHPNMSGGIKQNRNQALQRIKEFMLDPENGDVMAGFVREFLTEIVGYSNTIESMGRGQQ